MDGPELKIGGKVFRFVKRSRRGNVAVYSSGDFYMRLGERGVIERMAALHKKFDALGFPVPEITGCGEIAGLGYFTEKSLGDKVFSFLFGDDMAEGGSIAPQTFEKFIAVTEKFAQAELKSAAGGAEGISLRELIRPEDLAAELPEYGGKVLRLFDEAEEAVGGLPLVLTHGDFCSHNLFPAGVIDFERDYRAPFGYDIVTNIFQNKYFPASREYEYFQYYEISEDLEALYYKRLDAFCREHELPPLSKYRKPFEYIRAVWHTARNKRVPKLQRWRYDLFKKQYLL